MVRALRARTSLALHLCLMDAIAYKFTCKYKCLGVSLSLVRDKKGYYQ